MMRPLLAALLIAAPVGASAQPRRVPPVDQCASDRSFVAFRSGLNAAIARRDAATILSIVSDDISYSFGDAPGRAGFAEAWRLDRPAASPLWRELGAALRLGCARDREGALWAPSMSMPNEDDPDDATYGGIVVAVAPGAALRAAPSDRARIVAPLRYDVLVLPPDDDGRGAWVRAEMDERRRGWIRRSQVRAFTDYRAVFEKRGGRWRMTAFVAGD